MKQVRVPLLPANHRLLYNASKAEKMGHWLAEDEKGYEYVVGHFVRQRGDTTESVATDCYGDRRVWTTDKEGHTVETSPDAIARRWAESIPSKLRSRPWLLPDGKQPRGDDSVKKALDRLRGWALTYIAGKHRLSVWLWGEPGRGKTQASLWVGTELSEAGKTVERIEASELKAKLRATYNADQTSRRAFEMDVVRWKGVEILVLDDVGAEAQDEDVRAVLFGIINHRMDYEKPTLCTSNRNLSDLAATGIDPRLVSRLGSYQQIALTGPDYRNAKNLQQGLV